RARLIALNALRQSYGSRRAANPISSWSGRSNRPMNFRTFSMQPPPQEPPSGLTSIIPPETLGALIGFVVGHMISAFVVEPEGDLPERWHWPMVGMTVIIGLLLGVGYRRVREARETPPDDGNGSPTDE